MRKAILIILAALLLLSSCATNHDVAMSQNKSVKGKNGISRPDWVIQDQSNDFKHYASGYGTGKTFETALLKAKLNADANIALWVSKSVEAVRDRYLEETSEDGKETYIDRFVSQAVEAGKALLTGVTEVDFWEDKSGGVWVLHMIPVANVKAQIESTIKAVCTDASLFPDPQQASQAFDKLKEALDSCFEKN
jgi:hypothetical protein